MTQEKDRQLWVHSSRGHWRC